MSASASAVYIMQSIHTGKQATIWIEYSETDQLPGWQKSESRLYLSFIYLNLCAKYTLKKNRLQVDEHSFKIEGKKTNTFCWWYYSDSAENANNLQVLATNIIENGIKFKYKGDKANDHSYKHWKQERINYQPEGILNQ